MEELDDLCQLSAQYPAGRRREIDEFGYAAAFCRTGKCAESCEKNFSSKYNLFALDDVIWSLGEDTVLKLIQNAIAHVLPVYILRLSVFTTSAAKSGHTLYPYRGCRVSERHHRTASSPVKILLHQSETKPYVSYPAVRPSHRWQGLHRDSQT